MIVDPSNRDCTCSCNVRKPLCEENYKTGTQTFSVRLRFLTMRHKLLFMGSENRTALIMQFQLFAVASNDGFLGNVERRQGYDHLDEIPRVLPPDTDSVAMSIASSGPSG
jgi:hypothetical protein